MSSRNNRRVAAGLIMAICATALAWAQEEGSHVDLRKSGTAKQAKAAGRSRAPDDRVRCWQYGHLIFDGRIVAPVAKTDGVTELRAGAGRIVQLMDMNHGLCIVETTAR